MFASSTLIVIKEGLSGRIFLLYHKAALVDHYYISKPWMVGRLVIV
jgi:hypothetical protein